MCIRDSARLEQAGVPAGQYALHCDSHAHLLQYVQPGTADAVMFNFGWLPGACLLYTSGSHLLDDHLAAVHLGADIAARKAHDCCLLYTSVLRARRPLPAVRLSSA